jgi:hypothetical protein
VPPSRQRRRALAIPLPARQYAAIGLVASDMDVQNLSPARIVAHGGFIPPCLPIRYVPRVNNVNFALSVGTVVPTSVRVVDVVPGVG